MADQFPGPPPSGQGDSPFPNPYSVGQGGAVPPPGFHGYGQNAPGFGQSVPYGAFPVQRSSNAYSIVSLVLGVLSLFICVFGVVTGVVGVVFGIIGLRQSNADPERVGGKTMAIIGIVLSVIAVLLWGALLAGTWNTDTVLE